MQRHPVPGGIGYGAWSELAQDGVWIFDSRIALQLKTGVRVKPRVVADMPTVEYASYGMDMLCIIMDMASMAWSIFRGMLDIADPRQHKLVARRTERRQKLLKVCGIIVTN